MSWGGGQFDFTDLEVLTEHLGILAAFAVSATALFLIIETSGKRRSSSRCVLESFLPPKLCEGTKATLKPASHSTKGGGISTPPLDLTAEYEAHETRRFEDSECISYEGSMGVEEDEPIRVSPLPTLRSVGVYNEPIGVCLPTISRSARISNDCTRVCPPDNLRSVGVSTEFVESPYSSPAVSNFHTLSLSTGRCMGDNDIAGGHLQTTEMGGVPQMMRKLDSGKRSGKSQESMLRWQKIPPPSYDYLEMIGCTTSAGTTVHGMSGPSQGNCQPSQGSCQQVPQSATSSWQNEGDISSSQSRERKHMWLVSNNLDQELDENQICRQQESTSSASSHPCTTYPFEHPTLQSQAPKSTIAGSTDRVYIAAQSGLGNFSKEFSF